MHDDVFKYKKFTPQVFIVLLLATTQNITKSLQKTY